MFGLRIAPLYVHPSTGKPVEWAVFSIVHPARNFWVARIERWWR